MDVRVVAETDLQLAELRFWKMNLLAVSEQTGIVAAANGPALRIFELLPDFKVSQTHNFTLPHNSLSSETPDINRLRLCRLESDLSIASVTMDGQVCFFPLHSLSSGLICMNNYDHEFEDNSTWSVDCSGSKIAAGSNSHTVAIWEQGNMAVRLKDHGHNVPCVEFSPGGRFLASTSISASLIVWEADQVVVKFNPSEEWGWGVKWILKSAFIGETKESTGLETLQDYIIVHTTQTEIRLFSFDAANEPHLEQEMQDETANLFGHTRFSLLETLPSLSLLITGEWGGTRLYLFLLRRVEAAYTAELVYTHLVPQLIVGLAADTCAHTKRGRVYLLMTNSTLQVLEVRIDHQGITLSEAFV